MTSDEGVKDGSDTRLPEVSQPQLESKVVQDPDAAIFDATADVHYSSDEEAQIEGTSKEDQETRSSESDSSTAVSVPSTSESSESSGSESESSESSGSEGSASESEADDELAQESEEDDEGPIRSKNELAEEVSPSLPADYLIQEATPIHYLGKVSGIVERSIIIKSSASAEYTVIKEGAVLCLEDRTPLGLLFEIFGRLESPVYRIRYNSSEELAKHRLDVGTMVYYVVPSAEFELTSNIRSIKGTDASNCNDEELPPEEQEFSDDEKERQFKRGKKRKTSKKPTESRKPQGIPSHIRSQFTSLPSRGSVPQASPTNPFAQVSSMMNQVLNPQNRQPAPASAPFQQPALFQQPAPYQPAPYQQQPASYQQQQPPYYPQQGYQQSPPAMPTGIPLPNNLPPEMINLLSTMQTNFNQENARLMAQMTSLLANQTQATAASMQAAAQNMMQQTPQQTQQEQPDEAAYGGSDDGYDPEHPYQ